MREKERELNFQDWIARAYPELTKENRKKVKATPGDPDGSLHSMASSLTFQVTDACNLACKYCYQINKGKRTMPFEVAKLYIDKALSGEDGFREYLGPSPAVILEFIGGEPFLEIDLIDKIVDYFREQTIKLNHPWAQRYMLSICSNGVLYKDPKVQHFLQKNFGHISFSVTVDGTKELHDSQRVFPDGSPSYDLAHAAAMDWRGRGYYMGSKITIAPGNVKYLHDCITQMFEDGYTEINANCVYEKGWTVQDATELYNQIKKISDDIEAKGIDKGSINVSLLDKAYNRPMDESDDRNWCGGVGLMLSCDPDGRLFPCIRYMESSLGTDQKPLMIGDVWNGIGKREKEKECISCMHCVTRHSQSTDQCFYCPVAMGCAWCSAYNYQVNGTINKRVTFNCDVHKATGLGAVYYWNTYYKQHHIDRHYDLWCPKEWAIPIIGEEEYDKLAVLTESVGGYVNYDKTAIHGYKEPQNLPEGETVKRGETKIEGEMLWE